ncbi:MAG: GNAT family N-acetyltransferase [Chloroflexi bacterium]|nr:GNAT family N-acetyltransferase [Chloroflexota bacterium]MCI0576633.1 GNAT family N-acetyltransferase [Chloroflexota bacterium]MCI0646999.1 GNAT family N-acetyltransferase [Chloroflexota bacterium]MCI0730699.1 GNAT family N-acetyltransferase [Chloroflexota bacterium]
MPRIRAYAVTYRPGTAADSYATFRVFEETFADLSQRLGHGPTSWPDPEALARMWAERGSLYNHLAETAEEYWLAERNGQVVGFARSILRGDVRQLTEFFVRPGEQSAGMGRALLSRAFPVEGVAHRSIIASPDTRALALYMKLGVYPRFPLGYFWRRPEPVTVETDLSFMPLANRPATLAMLGELDKAVLGYRREIDHTWFIRDRQGVLYSRAGRPVGYGYLGPRNGPFALLDERDFPAVLAHAETAAAVDGHDHFGIEVPMINRAAVDYLLARGSHLHGFIALFMCDTPFGHFERYIVTSPPFFL